MRRLIDEYGLAILYAIVGAICLALFGLIFIGNDTEISKVVSNVVDNSTNQSVEIYYNITYDLDGGYFRVLAEQGDENTLSVESGVTRKGEYYLIDDLTEILSDPLVDEATGAQYYKLVNDEKLWLNYTKEKSFSLPHPYDKTEEIAGVQYNNLLFDGWTGSSLPSKSRNAIITRGSTGNRNYKANWTKGYYKIIYNNNLSYYKVLQEKDENDEIIKDYKALADEEYDISAWMKGATNSEVVEYGSWAKEGVSIAESGYEFLGHTFKCWNTNPDGSGSSYYSLASLTSDLKEYDSDYDKDLQQTITLYAQWELIDYRIDYNATKLETASNDNPTTYRIIDTFKLKNTTDDDYMTIVWYTVNPYVETKEERANHRFGTYSWTGSAYATTNEALYEFNIFTNEGVKQKESGTGSYMTTGTFKDQEICYGTYGDLTLYGYKTTGIKVYESHVTWTKKVASGTEKMSNMWVATSSGRTTIKDATGFEYGMTESEVYTTLELGTLINDILKISVPGYKFAGLETSDGILVFNEYGVAADDINYWNKETLNDVQIKTWAYGSNLELFVRWEPISYTVKLHSNY